MTPAARVQAAIDVIDLWQAGSDGLDRVLLAWGRSHRFAGSGDRRAIADLVYDAARRLRSAAWVAGAAEAPSGRDILRGSLMLDGTDPASVFTGLGHAPAPLSGAEQAPPRDLNGASRAQRFDYPDELEVFVQDVSDDVLSCLRERAPVDLRVNLLKSDPDSARDVLAGDGIETRPVAGIEAALRVVGGARRLQSSRAILGGLVEIQDVSSQRVAGLAAPRKEETVLDLCAGGGGKALALAAAMGGGPVLAHDLSPRRMADLPGRAERAGADVRIVATADLPALQGRCDLVFVDAPCSGSGAWRRNPDAKWHLTSAEIGRLQEVQARLLDQAAGLAGPHGRIVYATCSLFRAENEDQIEAFRARQAGWTLTQSLSLTPLDDGDGFFGASLTGPSNSC